jgi:hypothetical protein
MSWLDGLLHGVVMTALRAAAEMFKRLFAAFGRVLQ